METNGSFPHSLVVSTLHLETNVSSFESGWYLYVEVSFLS